MKGVFTALVSPFDPQGGLDLGAFRKILESQAEAGVAGVIPCGTTGESPTLSQDEKQTLIRTAIETLRGTKVRVLAGTGSNDTVETVRFSRWASDQGVAGVLVVTPYYNKPSQAGLRAHFLAVAEAVSCDVMLYNVPSRTGVSLTAETVVQLANHPRIRSLKEASAHVAFASEILDLLARTAAGSGFDLLAGDDAAYLPLLSVGAAGVVSVASNLFPRAMVKLQSLMDAGKIAEARELHRKYHPLFRDLFIESNPSPIKHALHWMGICRASLRMPLTELGPASASALESSLKLCGLRPGVPA